MPNMFGGSQMHPSYKPRALNENEVLINSLLYTITVKQDKTVVTCESVDGRQNDVVPIANLPQKVKDRIEALKK